MEIYLSMYRILKSNEWKKNNSKMSEKQHHMDTISEFFYVVCTDVYVILQNIS